MEGAAQHELILSEAIQRGLEIVELGNHDGVRRSRIISNGNVAEIIQGIPASWLNENAVRLCDDKQLTKELFHKLSIPTPTSKLFYSAQELQDYHPLDGIKKYVCKPNIGTNGKGVVLGINSQKGVERYINNNRMYAPPYLLEELIEGEDLRIQVINSEIIASCIRKPAFVVGDGKSTLSELIDARNTQIHKQNPANKITIDQETINLFEKQALELDSVISDKRKVQLKEIANMAQGGLAVDVTDEIDATFQKWVLDLARELRTGYFALDLICSNTEDLTASTCQAIEINAKAEWMHHTFSEVRTHDIAKIIVSTLFPDS